MHPSIASSLLAPLLLFAPASDATAAATPRLAWADYDADALPDLLVIEPQGRVRLFHSLGQGNLAEVTATTGLPDNARDATWQDIDSDGVLDLLLLLSDGRCSLQRGLGAGRFVDATSSSGLDRAQPCSQATWLDYDRDGHPDLALISAAGLQLARNDGAGGFEPTPLVTSGLPEAWLVPQPETELSGSAPTPTRSSSGSEPDRMRSPASGNPAAVDGGSGGQPLSGGFGASSHGGGTLPNVAPPACSQSIEDGAQPGTCIGASSLPTLGTLFPLGPEFNLDTSGYAGFGTTSPRSQVHVRGTAGEAALRLNTTSSDGTSKLLMLENNNSESQLTGGLLLYDGTKDQVRLSTLTAGSEQVRLAVNRVSGDVGIGTASPLSDLHVVGGPQLGALMVAPNDVAGNKDSELVLGEDRDGLSGAKLLYRGGLDRLEVRGLDAGVGTPLMTIERGGEVGIGTVSPAHSLHVVGTQPIPARVESSDTGVTRLQIANTSGTAHAYDIGVSGSTHGSGPGKLLIRDANSNAARMVIDTQGRVGVGQSNPTEMLHVQGNIRVGDNFDIVGMDEIIGFNNLRFRGAPSIGASHLIIEPTGSVIIPLDASSSVQIGPGAPEGCDMMNIRQRGFCLWDLLNVEENDGTDIFEIIPSDSFGDAQVNVYGDFSVANGSKNFVLDHPLDPANLQLSHNAVEGPGYYTFYRGNVVLDAEGQAWVDLPAYFDALNTEVSYQLTCVGAPALVYVAEEVRENRFRIAGGRPGLKVCWLVTGLRDDPWARTHPYEDEQPKGQRDRGRYYFPAGFGAPVELGIASGVSQDAAASADRRGEPAGGASSGR